MNQPNAPKRFKPHIEALQRYQTSTGRDIDGLRLDRNERVAPLPPEVVADIMSRFTPADLAAHPESAPFYGKLASFLGVDEDHLYVTNGITEGINFLYFTLTAPGDNVVVLDPTYPMYGVYARLNALDYRPFGYTADLLPDWATLERQVDAGTALIIVANPNLPVESSFRRDEVRRLATIAARVGAFLVVDEAYHYFGAETVIDLVDEIDNLIVLRTFSKAFGLASARVGFMVASPRNIEYIAKTRSLVESNTYSMRICEYMLDHPEIMRTHVSDVAAGAAVLKQGLAKLGFRSHGGEVTNGILVFIGATGAPEDCVKFLRARNIYIRGGFNGPFAECVRISIGRPVDMAQLLSALQEWTESCRTSFMVQGVSE
ncbi:MAG: histidinol-phosphate aminotransferase family protein [Sterolibacteriaceae bacterium MAG5]|nr:histidinol-phosphate aminotransferase family protein [Candidatus Nitricoxidireducens bremensis]